MRKLWASALVVSLFLFSTQVALPAGMYNKVGFGVRGGFGKHMMADKDVWKIGPFGNAEVKFGLHKNIMIGLIGTYGAVPRNYDEKWWAEAHSAADEQHNFLAELGTWIYFMPEGKFNPYLNLGTGIYSWYVQDENNKNVHIYDLKGKRLRLRDQQLTFMVGAGFEYMVNDYFSIGAGGRFHYLSTVFSQMDEDLKDTLGLPEGLVEGFAGITLYYPVSKDSDGDGVPDKLDECPDTPLGCLVDERGCPIDSDGDGVCDGLDQCPNTPRGCKVDINGCPIDSDKDGVCDGLDRCPDTPAGVRVNSRGCPDTDGDGVYDDEDKCPDTPKGCKVDEDGCPIDSDGDRVCDGLDRCPETPRGMEVDTSGCALVKALEEIKLQVNFGLNEAILDDATMQKLNEVYAILMDHPEIRVEIAGYCDNTGTDAINDPLSKRRAEAVRDYLIIEKGIAPDRLTAEGYGSKQPIADNATPEGRAKNRRVEFKIIE